MDISATVLAAVMNLMNIETEDDCTDVEAPASLAMAYHQEGWDFDPIQTAEVGILDGRHIRAIQLLIPYTKDTPRRWTYYGKLDEEREFWLAVRDQCEDTF